MTAKQIKYEDYLENYCWVGGYHGWNDGIGYHSDVWCSAFVVGVYRILDNHSVSHIT